ncbi:hypothetical protein B0H14DRAFT_2575201 [Mycena olivaceomarginata]|nr:hypothetical protein B0H14DRAFT_2575201 [Mycena olivaceomarginata]
MPNQDNRDVVRTNPTFNTKILHFDTKAVGLYLQTKFLRGFLGETTAHYDFMTNLSIMIQLLAAPANAILTLEVWVCIAWQLERVLANPATRAGSYRAQVIELNPQWVFAPNLPTRVMLRTVPGVSDCSSSLRCCKRDLAQLPETADRMWAPLSASLWGPLFVNRASVSSSAQRHLEEKPRAMGCDAALTEIESLQQVLGKFANLRQLIVQGGPDDGRWDCLPPLVALATVNLIQRRFAQRIAV